jgi:hypothetical protein
MLQARRALSEIPLEASASLRARTSVTRALGVEMDEL